MAKKFKAMGWNVITVNHANYYFFVTRAIGRAKRSNKPTIIIFKTTIDYGTAYAGSEKIHGTYLNDKELIEYKKEAYDLFNKMMAEIQSNTVRYIFRAKFGIQFVSDEGIEVIEN